MIMTIALIIISIAFVLLFVLFLHNLNTQKEDAKYFSTVWTDMRNSDEEHHEYVIRHRVREAVRYAYGISGDILHHLSGFLKKELKYVELIEKLGEYARSMFLYDTPLSLLEQSVFTDEEYRFPQLNKEQSKRLQDFLKDIHDGKRTPDALLELIDGLLFRDSFDIAIQLAENWNNSGTKH